MYILNILHTHSFLYVKDASLLKDGIDKTVKKNIFQF